jgi:urease accessory protein UreF
MREVCLAARMPPTQWHTRASALCRVALARAAAPDVSPCCASPIRPQSAMCARTHTHMCVRGACVRAHARACVRAFVRAFVHAFVHACVRACVRTACAAAVAEAGYGMAVTNQALLARRKVPYPDRPIAATSHACLAVRSDCNAPDPVLQLQS